MGKSSQKSALEDVEVDRNEEVHSEESSGTQIGSSGEHSSGPEDVNPQPTASTARKPRKKTPRGSHNLREFCYVVTRHSERGRPLSPEKAQKTFSNTCGAIARKHCKIIDEWNGISDVVRNRCMTEVEKRFQVSDEWRERFRASANIALRNGLTSWKTAARKWLDKSYELVKKKWPSITDEAEWEKFKKESTDPAFIAKSERMRALRASKPLNHRLGSAGKEGKRKVWSKQDRQLEALGRVPPVHNMLEDPRAREYARQHMTPEEWAGYEPMQEPVKNFTVRVHVLLFLALIMTLIHIYSYWSCLMITGKCPQMGGEQEVRMLRRLRAEQEVGVGCDRRLAKG